MRGGFSALVGGLVFAASILVAGANPSEAAPISAKPPVAAAPASSAMNIESLTPEQSKNAPDSTMVTLKGRTVSLGALRVEHQRRIGRLSSTPARAQFSGGGAVLSGRAVPGTSPALNGTMVPMQAIAWGAADYKSFCGAADASGCLYFPALTKMSFFNLRGLDYSAWDTDPLITDKAVCESLGGYLAGPSDSYVGCGFPYPTKYHANFSPGSPPPGEKIGSGVSSAKSCTSPKFMVVADPKGAIQMTFLDTADLMSGSASAARTCVVRVYVPK